MGWLANQFAADLGLEIADRGVSARFGSGNGTVYGVGNPVNVLPSQRRASVVYAAAGALDNYQMTVRVTIAAMTAAGYTTQPVPRTSIASIAGVQYRVLAVSTDPVATSYLIDLGGQQE